MRELKFRAWDRSNNCMWPVHGFRLGHGGIVQAIATEPSQDTDDWTWGVKDLSPLMQYTGLKDKNGVEIYEGDTVNIPVMDWLGTQEIRFEQAAFKFGAQPLVNLYGQEFEVIGNIYENPDLLK